MEQIDVMEGVSSIAPQATTMEPGDDALLVKFYLDTVRDIVASEEAGRPIFREVEMVDIRSPGSRNNVVRVARESDKNRFPKHYALFKNRVNTEGVEGTPLAEWPLVTRSQVEEMAFMNIKTVEQLAQIPDSKAGSMMGFYGLKQKATEWLEKANGIEGMQAKLDEKQQQIEMLMARLDKLEGAKTPTKKKVAAKKE